MQPSTSRGAHDGVTRVFSVRVQPRIQDGVWYRGGHLISHSDMAIRSSILRAAGILCREFFHLIGFDFVDSPRSCSLWRWFSPSIHVFVRPAVDGFAGSARRRIEYVMSPISWQTVFASCTCRDICLILLHWSLWGIYETIHAPRLSAVIGTVSPRCHDDVYPLLTMLSIPLLIAYAHC